MAGSPTLIRVGHGKKYHIPYDGKPLCEVGNQTKANELQINLVYADSPTCKKCLAEAKNIVKYLEPVRQVAI